MSTGERLVVAFGPRGPGVVLFAAGCTVEELVRDVGALTDELDLLPELSRAGVLVWKGPAPKLVRAKEGVQIRWEGAWREPNADEWIGIKRGQSPWRSCRSSGGEA